ncbi:MAG: cation-translocating P-type ATPase C-terminal domain-containing protein [Desulfovermiculus sp.]|nr:cation-translocating P-type ATPase C-terminal domain-containing protein [Desulfovermiculus sp.]
MSAVIQASLGSEVFQPLMQGTDRTATAISMGLETTPCGSGMQLDALLIRHGTHCLAFSKLWFVFNLRTPGSRFLDNDIVTNPFIAASIGLCTLFLVAAVYLPGLSSVLKTAPVGLSGWMLLLGMSCVPFVFGQGLRWIQSRRLIDGF